MWNNIRFLNDETAMEYLMQDRLLLVQFLIGQHVECRKQATVFSNLAAELGNRYNFAVVDVAESPDITRQIGVNSLPYLVYVRQGRVLGGYRGLVKARDIPELKQKMHILQMMPLEQQFVVDELPESAV